ncbi:serine hydrolase domain-containing protein [Actinomadura oligospora]|uniref:serine hydrolase domain-containing protein n=1 Tax=Actinomadura oligospora TaxID=111804 RepID=UPI0004B04C3C|nr:serine hydrolase domain-containing protein [Actinomadura oligospora]
MTDTAPAPATPTPATSTTGPLDAAHWAERLAVLAARHGVPGAGLGILADGEIAEAATGLANAGARIEATTDTLWQIGSISKVWTATVAMTLVDEGLLDLDAPVASALPGLRLGTPELTERVTLRHLLSHTSGIDGDFFLDTGRGDDCLERYAERLADAAANHPVGATMSYCNAGFTLTGRVLEHVTGVQWDRLMRERLYEPLGLTHTATIPEDVLRHRAAAGHVGDPPAVAPHWTLMRSAGPAGLICSTPRDVLAFARLHLGDGLAPDGTRLLSAGAAREMRERQVAMPDTRTLGDAWGLGWILMEWSGRRLYGHDGNTIGQSAFLRILPDAGIAVCLLTNGGDASSLYQDLYGEIFAELADVEVSGLPEPSSEPVPDDLSRYVGVYERASTRMEVFERDGGLVLRSMVTGELAEMLPEEERLREEPLRALEPGVFVVRRPGTDHWWPVTFYTLADGSPYVHHGVRATPKVG